MQGNELFGLAEATLAELKEASRSSPIDDLAADNGVIRDFMSIVDQVRNNPELGSIFMTDAENPHEGAKYPRTNVYLTDGDGVIRYEFNFGEIRRGRFALTIEVCDGAIVSNTMLFNRSCFTPEQETYMLLEGMINL